MPDYNIGAETTALLIAHEEHINLEIDVHNEKLNEHITKMEQLQVLLTHLANETDDSKRVDWKNNPERMQLIDQLRKDPELSHLFPQGKYDWKEGEVTNLTNSINGYIDRVSQTKISQESEKILQLQQELNKAVEIFMPSIKGMKALIDRIITNMGKR